MTADRLTKQQREADLTHFMTLTLGDIAASGLPKPHATGPNWIKWQGEGWQVVVRVGTDGELEADPYWQDPDGVWDRLFAPARFHYWQHLAAPLADVLANCGRATATALKEAQR